MDAVFSAILAVVFTSGVPEAVIAGLIIVAVCNVLFRLLHRNRQF